MKSNMGIHPKDEMAYDEFCFNDKWTILIVHDVLFSVLFPVSIHMEMMSQINLTIVMKYILVPFRHNLNTNK